LRATRMAGARSPTSSTASTLSPAMFMRSTSAGEDSSQETNSASQLSGTRATGRSSELCEEVHVVVEEEPQVVQVVTQQRQAVDAHAEGEAAHALRVVPAGPQHVRVHHPLAEDR